MGDSIPHRRWSARASLQCRILYPVNVRLGSEPDLIRPVRPSPLHPFKQPPESVCTHPMCDISASLRRRPLHQLASEPVRPFDQAERLWIAPMSALGQNRTSGRPPRRDAGRLLFTPPSANMKLCRQDRCHRPAENRLSLPRWPATADDWLRENISAPMKSVTGPKSAFQVNGVGQPASFVGCLTLRIPLSLSSAGFSFFNLTSFVSAAACIPANDAGYP